MEWFSATGAFEAVERELDKRRAEPGGDDFVSIPRWQRDSIALVPAILSRHMAKALQSQANFNEARIRALAERIRELERKI